MRKRINKILWYSDELFDGKAKEPYVSVEADGLDGLNEGEIFISNNEKDPAIFIRTSSGKVVRIGSDNLFKLIKDEQGNYYIHTPYALASDGAISSLGKGTSDGSGSGVGALYQLVDVLPDGDKVSGAEDGNVLMYDAATGKWYGKKVNLPDVDFSEIEGELVEVKSLVDALQAADVRHGKDITANSAAIATLRTELKGTSDALSALEGEHDALAGTVNDFLTGVDVDDTINRWKELEAFLAGYTETATLADLLGVKADKSVVDALTATVNSNYTTLDGLITAEKNRAVAAEGTLSGRITTNATNINKNAEAIVDIQATLADWFTLEDGVLHSKYGLASDQAVSSLGKSSSSGGSGVSYDRLDSWDNYDAGAGAVLSATLGYELKQSIENLDIGDFDLSGYLKVSDAKNTYATIASLNALSSVVGGKQDTISDIATIRANALLGKKAQSWGNHAIEGYATQAAVAETYFPKSSFTKANIKSTLGISDWALTPTKPAYNTSEVTENGNLYFTTERVKNYLTGAISTVLTSNLTVSRALISTANGKIAVSDVTSTELGYLDGVTSAIQTQLNNLSARIKVYEDVLEVVNDATNGKYIHALITFASDGAVSSLGVGASSGGGGGAVPWGEVPTSILPADSSFDIGSSTKPWDRVFASYVGGASNYFNFGGNGITVNGNLYFANGYDYIDTDGNAHLHSVYVDGYVVATQDYVTSRISNLSLGTASKKNWTGTNSADPSNLVTKDWVENAISQISIPDTSSFAKTTDLANYFPLAGGKTITGKVTISSAGSLEVQGNVFVGGTLYSGLNTNNPYATQSWVEGKGYITSVKINGSTKNPTNGVVDLGTITADTSELEMQVSENSQLIAELTTDFNNLNENKQDKITESNKLSYSLISGTPTIPSLSGYATQDWVSRNFPSNMSFDSLNSTVEDIVKNELPLYAKNATTLAGYGITDGVPYKYIAGADLNTVYDAGMYTLMGNGSNYPSASSYGAYMVLPYRKALGNTKPDYAAQLYFPNGDDGSKNMYFRLGYSEDWGEWHTVLDNKNFSGYALPLSGGGRINLEDGTTSVDIKGLGVKTNVATDGGWDRAYGIGNESYENSSIRFGGYGEAGNNLRAYISVGAQNYNSATLKVYPTYATILNSTILHTGNAYTASQIDEKLRALSGGNAFTGGSIASTIYPSTNAGANLGTGSNRWNYGHIENVYSNNTNTTSIELNSDGRLQGYGGFIDFHFNGSSADYTSRIIENASGKIAIIAQTEVQGSLGVTGNISVQGNITTANGSFVGNASSATKLATARTIWGQSFDGTGNVTGDLSLNNDVFIKAKSTNGTSYGILRMTTGNRLYIGDKSAIDGKLSTYIWGDEIYAIGSDGQSDLVIKSNGNVLIGTTTDNGQKLQVNGNILLPNTGVIYMRNAANTANFNVLQLESDNVLHVGYHSGGNGGNAHIHGDNIVLRYGASHLTGFWLNSSGRVTIGSTDLAGSNYKLYVNGGSYVNGNLTTSGWLTTSGIIYAHGGLEVSETIRGIAANDDVTWSINGANGAATFNNLTMNGVVTIYNAAPGIILHRSEGVPYIRFTGGTSNLNYGEIGVSAAGNLEFWNSRETSPSWETVALQPWVNSKLGSYATTSALNTVSSKVSDHEGKWYSLTTSTGLAQAWIKKLTVNGTYSLGTSGTKNTISGDAEWTYGSLTFTHGSIGSNYSTPWTITYEGSATFMTVSQTSDLTKKSVHSYTERFGVDEIASADVVYFTWKDSEDKSERLGTIAQYWKQIAPQCVYGEEGNMSMDYSTLGLVSSIINARAIVRHESEIDALKRRVKELEDRLAVYEAA